MRTAVTWPFIMAYSKASILQWRLENCWNKLHEIYKGLFKEIWQSQWESKKGQSWISYFVGYCSELLYLCLWLQKTPPLQSILVIDYLIFYNSFKPLPFATHLIRKSSSSSDIFWNSLGNHPWQQVELLYFEVESNPWIVKVLKQYDKCLKTLFDMPTSSESK